MALTILNWLSTTALSRVYTAVTGMLLQHVAHLVTAVVIDIFIAAVRALVIAVACWRVEVAVSKLIGTS